MTYDVLVIGGGPAGSEAALYAANHRYNVALVTETPPGGRSVWGSLVPSKVWLTAAHRAQEAGLHTFDLAQLREEVTLQSKTASALVQQKLADAGVVVYHGKAALTAANSVTVTPAADEAPYLLEARYIILATGSEPTFSPTVKPAPPHIIAPRLTGAMQTLPKSMLMVGGGVTGVEYASAFAALGVEVRLLQRSAHLLPRFDAEVVEHVEHWLTQTMGVALEKNSAVTSLRVENGQVVAESASGKLFTADQAFIAAGRHADLTFFAAGSPQPAPNASGALATNQFQQTSMPGVYAIGDATGAPMTVNHAQMQARIAVAHILHGTESTLIFKPIIEAVYTHPPLGQIGNLDASDDAVFISKTFDALLKTRLEKHPEGLLKIKLKASTRHILGAAAFGPSALEILGTIQLAMHHGITWDSLQEYPMPHPTYGEILTNL